ncbi:MAG: MerR family transcriptional regulator [Methanobrevibacter sp.]|jgi:hypothetical protein|nr:MerR family transcriptional regulator [Methanobrevibacter sp.]
MTNQDKHMIKEIHIKELLTSKKIVELIDTYPALEKISCPNSIYNRVSKKYIGALNELEISIEVGYDKKSSTKYSEKYSQEKGLKVLELLQENKTPSEIATILNLSVKTVYYLKNRSSNPPIKLKKGRKRKYTKQQIKNIKNLHEKAIPVKEISKIENIPIRTLYYIIKNYISNLN